MKNWKNGKVFNIQHLTLNIAYFSWNELKKMRSFFSIYLHSFLSILFGQPLIVFAQQLSGPLQPF
jgi:hypothetical protein